jgi:hypothetical protein
MRLDADLFAESDEFRKFLGNIAAEKAIPIFRKDRESRRLKPDQSPSPQDAS